MHRTVFTLRPVGALAIIFIMTLALVGYAYIATQPEGGADTVSSPLPQVTNIKMVDNRQFNAYIEWAAPAIDKSVPLKDRYTGYSIVYHKKSDPTHNLFKVTTVPAVQIQDVAPGEDYEAVVATIDSLGRTGQPSAPITFRSDDSEVVALKKQFADGKLIFFDDFDLPPGAMNATKWSSSLSSCSNTKGLSGAGINNQKHFHQSEATGSCDRGGNFVRMRALMDLTDKGTRELKMTQDITVSGPASWYAEFLKEEYANLDRTPRINLTGFGNPDGTVSQAWPGTFEVNYNNDFVMFKKTDNAGVGREVARANLAKLGFVLDNNLQHRVKYSLAPDMVTLTIDDREVLKYAEKGVLEAKKYGIMFAQLEYNANKLRAGPDIKGQSAGDFFHLDQVSLSAAPNQAKSDVAHNYQSFGNYELLSLKAGDFVINVPDSVLDSSSTAAKQRFHAQMAESDTLTPPGSISINGTKFTIPNPKETFNLPGTPDFNYIRNARSFPFVIDVGTSVKTGENKITYASTTRDMKLINPHIEIVFPNGKAPVYSQPSVAQVASANNPNFNTLGPDALITSIGGKKVTGKDERQALFDKTNGLTLVSGVNRFEIKVGNYNSRETTGAMPGISGLQLVIDGKVIATKRTDTDFPSPLSFLYFDIDTNKLASGLHQMFIEPFGPGCVLGRNIKSHALPGFTGPFYFKLDNKITANSLPEVTPVCQSKTGTSTKTAPDMNMMKMKMDATAPAPHHGTGEVQLNAEDITIPPDDPEDASDDPNTL